MTNILAFAKAFSDGGSACWLVFLSFARNTTPKEPLASGSLSWCSQKKCPKNKHAAQCYMAVILAVLPFNKLTQSIDINRFYRYIMMIILNSLSWKTKFFRIYLCQLTGGLNTSSLRYRWHMAKCLVTPLLSCTCCTSLLPPSGLCTKILCKNLPGKRCYYMMFDDPVDGVFKDRPRTSAPKVSDLQRATCSLYLKSVLLALHCVFRGASFVERSRSKTRREISVRIDHNYGFSFHAGMLLLISWGGVDAAQQFRRIRLLERLFGSICEGGEYGTLKP